jgi:hypothetical protein
MTLDNLGNLILTKNKTILFVGKRLDPIQKAIDLGFETYVLNFKKPQIASKVFKNKKYSELAFTGNFDMFKTMSFDAIIPLTEKSIPIAQKILEESVTRKSDFEKFNICHDKFEMKNHAKKCHIPMTKYILIDENITAKDLSQKLGFPLVLKERNTSGSRGLKIVHSLLELEQKIKPNMLAEKYIRGKEYSIESFVSQEKVIFSNITDYHQHHTCNILPAKLNSSFQERLLKFNTDVIRSFGIKNGMTHIEYYLSENNILFGEIAIRPPGGYIMRLIELSYGFSPWKALIEVECGETPLINTKPKGHSAVWILHPGECVIQEEPNFIPLLNDTNLINIQSGLKVGMQIKKREGSGEDFGRILLKADTYDSLLETINHIKDVVEIKTNFYSLPTKVKNNL